MNGDRQPFSVSMCVYGGDDPEHFREAVKSVLDQTVLPDEVVLTVDGPVPEPMEQAVVWAEQACKTLRVVRLPENQGHGAARRAGLAQCGHSLVAVMDADDLCEPDRFQKQLAYLQDHPETTVVGGMIREFIGDPSQVCGVREVPQQDEAIKEYLKSRCPFNQMTVMFRKELVEQAGGYLDWYCDEDYYLWIRLYEHGAVFHNLPDCLVNVRVGADMYKRRGGWRYFKSEASLQNYMRKKRIIGTGRFLYNVALRFGVQVMMPGPVRGWVFQKFARRQDAKE